MLNTPSRAALLALAVASCTGTTTREQPASSASPQAVAATSETPPPASAPTSPPAPAAPVIDASTIRIFVGDAPDDGPAYVLSRGPVGRDGCNVREGSRQTFRVGLARGEFRGEPPFLFELYPNQDLIEASACDAERCFGLKSGTVEVHELEVGKGARGEIDLTNGEQSLQLSFEAVWCGPLDRPPWQVRRSPK